MTLRNRLLGLTLSLLPMIGAAAPVAAQQQALSSEQARQAAQAILDALQQRNGSKLYNLMAAPIRQATTPAKIQSRLSQQKGFDSAFVSGIIPGIDDTTVETRLSTAKGSVPLTLVLDAKGQLLAWELDNVSSTIKQRAEAFIGDISANRLVSARSYLSLAMQQELTPQALAKKWADLQRVAGSFQGIRGSLIAQSGGSEQLVLVTSQFSRLTDNLFVIFDAEGRIVGVDFPRPAP